MNIGDKTKTLKLVNISKIFFLQIISNHIIVYLKLAEVAYNNK